MSANYSANDNQNIFVASGRTTSRVLNPPGGQCSITLGTYVPPKKEAAPDPKKAEPVLPQPPAPQAIESTAVAEESSKTTAPSPTTAAEAAPPVSANAFASGSNMNGAQVMTGRPTSRVLAPPGGHTSIRLG